MPKRMRDKHNTVLVKFYENITDKEVRSVLAHMGLSGTRVSTLVRRWAVEVPYWLEGDYIVKFYNNDMVEAIHNSFNKTEESEEQEYGQENNQ
jgi:hypothetical protein